MLSSACVKPLQSVSCRSASDRQREGVRSFRAGFARPLGAPERLAAAQRKQLREVFDAIDTDGSDELDYTELKDALANFGVKLSLKELKQVWISADANGDSAISFEEFCTAVESLGSVTLVDRQESMKALQDRLRGGGAKEDEGSSCLLM